MMPAMTAAMDSSPVITGRRMQSSEMFIPPPFPSLHLGDALRRRRRVAFHRPGALGHPLGAVDDHLLARLDIAADDSAVADRALHRHGPPPGGVVVRQHEEETPLLAGLHRG